MNQLNEFSWIAGLGGLVGVVWLELVRITSRVSRGKRLWNGLRPWQYGLVAFGFMSIATLFAGFAVTGFVSAVFIGFGIEGGPVATGILASGGDKPAPRIEEIPDSRSPKPGIGGFFTEA